MGDRSSVTHSILLFSPFGTIADQTITVYHCYFSIQFLNNFIVISLYTVQTYQVSAIYGHGVNNL
jgi:uncharacterized membrane protein YagU involved in acid resistance